MATGIPLSKSTRMNYHIEYDGKESIESILNKKVKTVYKKKEEVSVPSSNDIKGTFYLGDNLASLHYLLEKYGSEILDAVYIDPPYAKQAMFATKKQAKAYDDNLSGAEYLEFIRKRLVLIHKLLKPTGSIFVHLDETMAFAVKIIMDEIFGVNNFHNWITRQKSNPKNTVTRKFGDISDYIMFYSKSNRYNYYPQHKKWDLDSAKREYNHIDPISHERYKLVPIYGPGIRNGKTGQKWHGMYPPAGKHWQYTPEKLTELDNDNQIHWSKTGNPRKKVFFKDSKGPVYQDILMDFKDANNQNIKITGYPTEKNLDLVQLLLKSVTKPGDLILDAFAGSSTTAEAAMNLGCDWIMLDNSSESLKATQTRFTDISKKHDNLFDTQLCSITFYEEEE